MDKKTSTAESAERKRRIAVAASLFAAVLVIVAGLILAGCRKTPSKTVPVSNPSGGQTTGNPDPGMTFDVTGTLASKKAENAFLSPSSVEVTEKAIYVSDATNFAVYKLSTEGKVEKTVTFSATVSRVRAEGGKVYVLWGELDGSLSVFDEDLRLEKTVKVGHTPSDL